MNTDKQLNTSNQTPSDILKLTTFDLNQFILDLMPAVRQAKVHVITSLTKNIKKLRAKKTKTDEEKEKNERRAVRLYEEITSVKIYSINDISKCVVSINKTFKEVGSNNSSSPEERIITRIADCKHVQTRLKAFREKYINWEKELTHLLRALGLRHRKKKLQSLDRRGKCTKYLDKENKILHLLQRIGALKIDPRLLNKKTFLTFDDIKVNIKSKNSKTKQTGLSAPNPKRIRSRNNSVSDGSVDRNETSNWDIQDFSEEKQIFKNSDLESIEPTKDVSKIKIKRSNICEKQSSTDEEYDNEDVPQGSLTNRNVKRIHTELDAPSPKKIKICNNSSRDESGKRNVASNWKIQDFSPEKSTEVKKLYSESNVSVSDSSESERNISNAKIEKTNQMKSSLDHHNLGFVNKGNISVGNNDKDIKKKFTKLEDNTLKSEQSKNILKPHESIVDNSINEHNKDCIKSENSNVPPTSHNEDLSPTKIGKKLRKKIFAPKLPKASVQVLDLDHLEKEGTKIVQLKKEDQNDSDDNDHEDFFIRKSNHKRKSNDVDSDHEKEEESTSNHFDSSVYFRRNKYRDNDSKPSYQEQSKFGQNRRDRRNQDKSTTTFNKFERDKPSHSRFDKKNAFNKFDNKKHFKNAQDFNGRRGGNPDNSYDRKMSNDRNYKSNDKQNNSNSWKSQNQQSEPAKKALHPSWEAKKKLNDFSMTAFQGKKITFDD